MKYNSLRFAPTIIPIKYNNNIISNSNSTLKNINIEDDFATNLIVSTISRFIKYYKNGAIKEISSNRATIAN